MKAVPKLEERLMNGSEDDLTIIAELVSTPLTLTCDYSIVIS